MIKNIQAVIFFAFLVLGGSLNAQDMSIDETLNWKGLIKENIDNIDIEYLYFENAIIEPENILPQYATSFSVPNYNSEIHIQLTNEIYKPFNPIEIDYLKNSGYFKNNFEFSTEIFLDRNNPVASVKFIPIRYNTALNTYEKLVSFTLEADASQGTKQPEIYQRLYADNSVLSQGEWFKISVSESGIHKISFTDLQNMGINLSGIQPKNIRLYGNGGNMLPEKNIHERHDDLMENAIFIEGEEDGIFDPEDYILFYGMSPHLWEYRSGFFNYVENTYDDFSYYYLTISSDLGKRIEFEQSATGTVSYTTNQYNDNQVFEEELVNLIYSGRVWYGDLFGVMTNKTYNFQFPNINQEENALIKVNVANRNIISENMIINVSNMVTDSVRLTAINTSTHKFAQTKNTTIDIEGLESDINIELIFNPQDLTSRLWLNFININAISNLRFLDGQLSFRDINSIGDNTISKFTMSNSNDQVLIWDITDPLNPILTETNFNSGETSITVKTNVLKEFVAFDGSHYKSPQYVGSVTNQNLHGAGPFDLVIVSPPIFKEQAQRLEELHESHDGMRVLLVDPKEIYNEFSSGKQDPTAIRDFIKMLYDKYDGDDAIRYLLLFGDGSYDPKDRIENNTNFVPTFQTMESLLSTASYVVDDYFGLLDDNEGNDGWGLIDIGIGRIPVQTVEEAKDAVDKIYRYITPGEEQFGKWRTKICLIADDEDGNLHLEQADSLEFYITDNYTTNKIYLDAFEQISTPTGDKYPEANLKINEQVEDGALIINYVGHGGISGWSHERVVTLNDINSWKNVNKLPLFVTATCEFSPFDHPHIVSAGEEIYRNPIGGGIALLTTTRVAYAQSNFRLNLRLNSRAFTATEDGMPFLGDLIRESKPPGQLTTRNFVLLGDPALRLAYPKYNITTTSFMGKDVDALNTDTIRSLQKIAVAGEITDNNGNKVIDFNGLIFPELFDKPRIVTTLGNDESSIPVDFELQDQILWHGQYEVKNGEFSFEFIVPKDMTFSYGKGKLSYYAYSSDCDASGSFSEFSLGGIDENAMVDNLGPEIELFINDYNFKSGGLTHPNPLLIAHFKDENGINLSSNGIGHEITLLTNDDYSNKVILNDLYICDTNSYKSGTINYPYYDLPDGNYTLNVKAWDSYNNSNEASIEFVINGDAELEITEVKNVPNPFANSTQFQFHHTKPGQELDIELQIFDMNGQFVISYATTILSENTATTFLEWDGKDVNVKKVPAGIYIYQVKVTDEKGNVNAKKQKLIIW